MEARGGFYRTSTAGGRSPSSRLVGSASPMRKILLVVGLAALVGAGYALGKPAGPRLAAPLAPHLTGACAKANLKTLEAGKLTLATDNPAYPPWWDGHERKSSGFKLS